MLEAIADRPVTVGLAAPGVQGRSPRFGVTVSGVRLMLPEKTACDYVLRPHLFSLPMAPARMLGLIHSRGYGIPVFEASLVGGEHRKRNQVAPVLIVGQGSLAGGLVVDAPPTLLAEVEDVDESNVQNELDPARSKHPVFANLELQAFRARLADVGSDAIETATQVWWEVDFNALFLRLSQLKGSF
jgi:hypothetical protein